MGISETCVKRPVFATVINLLILLVGIMAFLRLPIREYPSIDEPIVRVETRYTGASAEIIESRVTQILEESLSGIEGVSTIASTSRQERSVITITFRVGRDIDEAANDVRDRVSRVRSRLPDDIDEPQIAKQDADATPIMFLAFSSDRHDSLFISDYADRRVKNELQTIPGVAEVRVFGERRYAMRLWLDRERLAAYSLTPQDVGAALTGQNVEIPTGRIESAGREFTVLAETDLRTEAEFEDLIIRRAQGYLVRLKDVGRVELGPRDDRVRIRNNGAAAIGVGIIRQSTANPLDITKTVRAELPRLIAQMPEGMQAVVSFDSTIFIERSIEAVFKTIAEAVLLVMVVIFFFLRSWRATLVPMVTIPVSLFGAFALMALFGFTINTLTLLAFVLAIGLVVDDAIVMLENIHRHVEEGTPPLQAAILGSREIGFAIVAMTLTLASVFAPLAFVSGRTGQLFAEFALTLAGAVVISGFTALTLSPMMCGQLLRHEASHGLAFRAIEGLLVGVTRAYRWSLEAALAMRPLVFVITLMVAAASALLFTALKQELAPVEDRGFVLANGFAPEGATIDFTDRYAKQLEEVFLKQPELTSAFVIVGWGQNVAQMLSFVRFADWSERTRNSQEIANALRGPMAGVAGLQAFPSVPPSLGQRNNSRPIEFVIKTNASYAELDRAATRLAQRVRETAPAVAGDLRSDLNLTKPQLAIRIDRDKAADLGVEVAVVGRTLETMLGGREVTRFKRDGQQYDVVLQVADVDRRDPGDITRIFVRGREGQMIQLSNIVQVVETVAPRELNRFNRLRSATLSANVAPGYALDDALRQMEAAAKEVLPPGMFVDYSGQSREFKDSTSEIYIVFLLAIIVIYLVLAAQFESFVDPLIIMLTVPLSTTGALAAILWTGGTLNIYSQIGIVALVGLITKNGILIVEFANQLRGLGRDARAAVVESATLRLRPILMTSAATILGAVPLALAVGAGAESRQQIGWVIVGGMGFGTLLTLYVVPAAYLAFARKAAPGALDVPTGPSASASAPAE